MLKGKEYTRGLQSLFYLCSESCSTTELSGGCCNAAKAMFCSIVGRRPTSVVEAKRAESIKMVRAVSAGVEGRDCAVSISASLSEEMLPPEEWAPTIKNWPALLWVRTRFT